MFGNIYQFLTGILGNNYEGVHFFREVAGRRRLQVFFQDFGKILSNFLWFIGDWKNVCFTKHLLMTASVFHSILFITAKKIVFYEDLLWRHFMNICCSLKKRVIWKSSVYFKELHEKINMTCVSSCDCGVRLAFLNKQNKQLYHVIVTRNKNLWITDIKKHWIAEK